MLIKGAIFKLNLMKFLGFENDDDYNDDDDYSSEQSNSSSSSNSQRNRIKKRNKDFSDEKTPRNPNSPSLIMFKGVPNEQEKKILRDAFNNGTMLLLDLHELSQREFEEDGRRFVTFMGGMAFNRGGEIEFIEPSQYLVTPQEKMFLRLPEEDQNENSSNLSNS